MKFQAFRCDACSYSEITANENPVCPDCKNVMRLMDTSSAEYKKIDADVKKLFRMGK